MDNVIQEIHRLEQKLLDPVIRSSMDDLANLLDADFIEIGSSGKIWDRQAVLNSLLKTTGETFIMRDFNGWELSSGVVLVTYQAIKRLSTGESLTSWRSSIWRLKDGRWQMIFHQGTPS